MLWYPLDFLTVIGLLQPVVVIPLLYSMYFQFCYFFYFFFIEKLTNRQAATILDLLGVMMAENAA